MSAELFKTLTGTDIVHISYKGGAPAVNDLYAGHVSAEPPGSSPGQTAAHIRNEIAKWTKVIKASGAKADG